MFADCDFGEMDKFCNTYGDEDDEDEETLRARTSLRMLWALGGGLLGLRDWLRRASWAGSL